MKRHIFRIFAVVGMALASAGPAHATSCNMQEIERRTIDETARDILRSASFVGFARIDAGDGEDVPQQRLEMVFPLKGDAGTILMMPYREGRIAHYSSAKFKRVRGRPGELVFVALWGARDNAWVPVCILPAIRRFEEADLYAAIGSSAGTVARKDPPG